jgi:hypothetical protein
MTEEEKTFRVTDKRLFTPDGEVREEPAGDALPGLPGEASQPPHDTSPAGPVDFGGFLLSLGAQGSVLLSSDEAEGLDGVRQIVAILEMLKEKTSGHRTGREDEILESLLYQLRLGYLGRAQKGGA